MEEDLDYCLGNKGLDLVARIYLKPCPNYMVNSVPPDWTDIETLCEK